MDLPLRLKPTLLLIFTFSIWCYGQNVNTIRAVVVQDGTKVRVEQVSISNKRSGQRVSSDKLGLFEIICKIGDTLMIERIGYQELKMRVQNYAELTIHLKPTNLLNGVSITGQRASAQLREISATYSKEKGIFYGGKPPLR